MDKYKIRVAVDTEEGRQFVDWLNGQGHEAVLGTDTGDHIDGVIGRDVDCNGIDWDDIIKDSVIMNQLWDDYCNSI